MYAHTDTSYREIASETELLPGELLSAVVPQVVLSHLRRQQARGWREGFLRASDWTQVPDSPLGLVDKQAWATYRAALRALPQQPGFPDVEWPRPPNLADGTADQPEPGAGDS
ncbi:tail fiber assembly protein [Lysobacter antibioticus]|uniref:tail fiber assembly protein n=1 Tax=Lysobacter antibioticus TaxID=84531 RepID=UPI0007165114